MKKIPPDKRIALLFVVLMLASMFAGAAPAYADDPETNTQVSAAESALMRNTTAISGDISVTHVTSLHAEPSKATLAPNENYVISVDYYVSHGDDYYFKAWYYEGETWTEFYSQHIVHTSAGWFSLSINSQAPEKMGNYTVRVAGTQDYWSTPYDYNVAHDFEISVTTPLPDLAISTSDIDISHTDNKIDIIATIHNDGAEDANDVFVQFYAKDFLTGTVTQIAKNKIESIPHGLQATSSAMWEPTLQYYRICVSVDPDDEITETDENNNIACKSVGGPTIVDVKAKYKGTFLQGISAPNEYFVWVDWRDTAPGYIKFILNGNPVETKSASSGNPCASLKYDIGSLANLKNELKIIAVDANGVESDPHIYIINLVKLTPWMFLFKPWPLLSVVIKPWDNILSYQSIVKVPDPALDTGKTAPSWIPIVGGKYGVLAQFRADFLYKTICWSEIRGGGQAKVEAGDKRVFGVIGQVLGSGSFDGEYIYFDTIGAMLKGYTMFKFPYPWWIVEFGVMVRPEIGGKFLMGIERGIAKLYFKSGEVPFNVRVEGYAQAGPDGVASVCGGVGAKPSITFQFCRACDFIKKAALELYIRAKVTFLFTSLEHREFWKVWPEASLGMVEQSMKLLRSENTGWKPLERDYITEDYSNFVGNTIKPLSLGSTSQTTETTPLITNIFPYAEPTLAIDSNDHKMVVWVHDDKSKNLSQSFEIYYAYWDGAGWSTPSSITENFMPDFKPDVEFSSNDEAVAAWVVVKNETLPETSTPDQIFPYMEIACSVFNQTMNMWSQPQVLTNNSLFDDLPAVEADESGNIMVMWMRDEDNTISLFGENVPFSEDVYYSIWDGNQWTDPVKALDNIGISKRPEFAYDEDKAITVWDQDTDGNLSTINDREIFYSMWGGNIWTSPIQFTDNNLQDVMPRVVYDSHKKANVIWVTKNQSENFSVQQIQMSTFDGNKWSVPQLVTELASGVNQLEGTQDLNDRLVIIWQTLSDAGVDIDYSVFDEGHNQWGKEKLFTLDNSSESSLSIVMDSNSDIWATYLKTNVSIVNETVNIEGKNMTIPMPHFGESDLYILRHSIYQDMKISNADIMLSDSNSYAGEEIIINATVHNIGDLSIDDVKVAFLDGLNGTQIGGTQNISVLHAGRNATVSVNWTVPTTEQSHTIYVKVDPYNEITESNESNNIAFVGTVLPDLIVNWTFASYSMSDRQININTSIKNNGTSSASNITVEFYYGNYTDFNESALIKIGTKTIDSLAAGDSKEVGITWDVSAINRSWYGIYVVVDPDNTVQESDESNNEDTALAKVLPDLTLNASDIEYSDAVEDGYSNAIEGNISINITVHNKGVYDAENITLSVYNGCPTINSSIILANRTIPLIRAHDRATTSYEWSALPGMYDIYVVIDPDNLIDELDKSNNIALNPVIITPGADLTLNGSDITFSDNNPPRGEFVIINATVHNNGDGDALGTFVQLFAGNPDTNGTLIADRTITLIPAGGSGTACMEPVSAGSYNLSWILTSGLHDIYVKVDPSNNISETNESNNIAFNTINVTENIAPSFSNVSLSPLNGSWKDEFTYAVDVSDAEGDDVSITLQTFTNGNWTSAEAVSVNNTTSQKIVALRHRFTSVDRSQTAKYRFYYQDEVNKDAYHSETINEGYYPSESGLEGPELDNTSYGLGIVEGAGAGYGSSFYSWSSELYTVAQPSDSIYVTASDSINKIGIYDYSDDKWYYYPLNKTFLRGETADITSAFKNHQNHFVRVRVYLTDAQRDFHIIKQTLTGGTVESGYAGYGGSFTTWSTYANTFVMDDDMFYIAADAPVNKIKVLHYMDNQWHEYNITNIVPGHGVRAAATTLPKGELIDITSYLQPFVNRFVQIKILQDSTERSFHVIKRTKEGGIVEGAQGDQSGSSFYSWSSSLYTVIQPDDHVYVTADDMFNFIKIIDKTTGEVYREYIFNHDKGEIVDIVSYLQYLPNYINHLIEIQVYGFETQRNFHMVKITPDGGIVEGGYADSHSSFGSWASSMYMLYRCGDRIQIAADAPFNTLKVYDYTDDKLYTINLGNVYPKYTLVDVTPYLYKHEHEGHFIQLRVYDSISEKNFHLIKVCEKQYIAHNESPVLSNVSLSPSSGSWKDGYKYSVNVSDVDSEYVNVTLQIFTNDKWINVETKQASGMQQLEWNYSFICLDRNQTAKYRFYYDDGVNIGYYPSKSGLQGPKLDSTSYGLGIVEGAGAGYGSSFYSWSDYLYTIVQPGDKIHIIASDSINRVGIYDYTDDTWYYYRLNKTFLRGEIADITEVFNDHFNHFVQIKVYLTDSQRSFHMMKQTSEGGMVEGGYPGYGSSFTSWSTYINTIIREGDKVYVAADAPVNKIKILNYNDDKWYEYDIATITPRAPGVGIAKTTLPKGKLIDVTPYLQSFTNRLVQIKVLQDSTEKNFHIIKKTREGGIVEGAEGGTGGSSFYSWYSSLYTVLQKGDLILVAADSSFNKIKIYDYTTGQWRETDLERTSERGDVTDLTPYLQNYVNHLLQIQVYNDTTLRNFHLVKITPSGGIVEGGYPNKDSSFHSWASEMYMLFRKGERVIIAPTDYIDTIKIYDHTDDREYTYNLGGNVYPKYSLDDITPYISKHGGHFIRLQVYYQASQKSFHLIKASSDTSHKVRR